MSSVTRACVASSIEGDDEIAAAAAAPADGADRDAVHQDIAAGKGDAAAGRDAEHVLGIDLAAGDRQRQRAAGEIGAVDVAHRRIGIELERGGPLEIVSRAGVEIGDDRRVVQPNACMLVWIWAELPSPSLTTRVNDLEPL